MQIQRIQTLWLILALGCLIAYIVLPFGTLVNIDINGLVTEAPLFSYDFVGLIIPVGLAVLLCVIAIVGYSNLKYQQSMAVLTLMFELVSIGITVYLLCDTWEAGTPRWGWETGFLGAALVFTILAMVGIAHDRRLLRSYDRLR